MMHEWKVTQQRYGRLLRQRIRRLMRRREKILRVLAKARGWEELRRKGELLRVHHQRIGRGLAEVTVPDYYAEAGRPLPIALAPAPRPMAGRSWWAGVPRGMNISPFAWRVPTTYGSTSKATAAHTWSSETRRERRSLREPYAGPRCSPPSSARPGTPERSPSTTPPPDSCGEPRGPSPERS